MLVKRLLFGILILHMANSQLQAKDRPFIDEPDNTIREDFEEPQWQEQAVTLPAGFRDENLQEFKLDNSSARFHYFIDRSSLQTAGDGVTRFLLVIRSVSGATNSSYEGIRCGEREYKVYAYGGAQGLKPVRKPLWSPIPRSGRDNYRQTLYQELLCNLTTGRANPPEAVVRAMKTQQTLNHFPFAQD